MTSTPTNNPVPSDHPADARDNFERIDEVVNLPAPQTSVTRTGKRLRTLRGLQALYLQTPINGGVWAPGISFTDYNQFMIFNGVSYKPKSTTTLPYVSTASPDTNFVEPFSDLTSSNLSDLTFYVAETIADLLAGSTIGGNTIAIEIGQFWVVNDYYGGVTHNNSGHMVFEIVASGTGTADGGRFIDIPSVSLQARQTLSAPVSVRKFGARGNGTTNDAQAFQSATNYSSPAYVPPGSYNIGSAVTGSFYTDGSVTISGSGSVTVRDIFSNDGSNLQNVPARDGGARSIIQYAGALAVRIRDVNFPMSGFRFQGQYKKSNVPVFTSANQQTTVSASTDLSFGMSSDVKQNWYAVFACANNGDANASFKLVPFLRVESVAGSTVTLRRAGEAVHGSAPQTYTWANDALNGVECLVITETIDGRAIAFSGRETTITDSTPTTVTLQTIGSVAVQDWLLPAPSGFDHYRYCGSFYMDTQEVRNIADTGNFVKSRGIFDQSGTNTGAVSSLEVRQPSGYISPLATAVSLISTGVLSTTGTGQFVEEMGIDSSHVTNTGDLFKTAGTSASFNFGEMTIPFSFGPQYYYSNGGTLAGNRINGQQNLWGWIEP